jgi:parallel beta-helix repeat protein
VEADNVTIEGFTVQPDPVMVTHDGVGIFTSRFHAGYDVRHNVVQDNSIGIYVNSNGSFPTQVRENCARNNNLTGAAGGNGIYSDQGLSNAEITNNYLTGDENGSIVVDSFLTAPHDISITHNESVNDGAIVTFSTQAPTAFNLTVDYNKVVGSVGSGIVTDNVTSSEYAYNDVESGTFNGVSLHETTNSTVKSNKAVAFQEDGIRLGDSSNNNTVATNRAVNNLMAGLQLTEQSSGNTVRENHMNGNHPDCSDTTAGPGTAGTANFWTNDFGETEDHPGICKHATP